MRNLDWFCEPDTGQKHHGSDWLKSTTIVDAAVISHAIRVLIWNHMLPLIIARHLWQALSVWCWRSGILIHGIAYGSTARPWRNHVGVISCILIARNSKVLRPCMMQCHCKSYCCAPSDLTRYLHVMQCLGVPRSWNSLPSKPHCLNPLREECLKQHVESHVLQPSSIFQRSVFSYVAGRFLILVLVEDFEDWLPVIPSHPQSFGDQRFLQNWTSFALDHIDDQIRIDCR